MKSVLSFASEEVLQSMGSLCISRTEDGFTWVVQGNSEQKPQADSADGRCIQVPL